MHVHSGCEKANATRCRHASRHALVQEPLWLAPTWLKMVRTSESSTLLGPTSQPAREARLPRGTPCRLLRAKHTASHSEALGRPHPALIGVIDVYSFACARFSKRRSLVHFRIPTGRSELHIHAAEAREGQDKQARQDGPHSSDLGVWTQYKILAALHSIRHSNFKIHDHNQNHNSNVHKQVHITMSNHL